MKDEFLRLKNHNDISNFFGLSYPELVKIIYSTNPIYRYHQFEIPKKNGGIRKISSPSKKLKNIQSKLKDIFYEIYPTRPSVHGFSSNKSIVSNAEQHLDKKYIFNLDLVNFFGSIHFGRVRNLFKSEPFKFNNTVSTILAQICCFDNSLPQGAPTSPILSNMIAWKMDSQLQHLAKKTNSTYTRYADDITFSFTCNKYNLPQKVVILNNDKAVPGSELIEIINRNGFNINNDKVRLCSMLSRMEVTGLTVNEVINVKRQYVRKISSMLHAWEKYGYDLAEKEYNEKYNEKHRASDQPKSFSYVVKGKLAFLKSVRTRQDPFDAIFNKLATRFNNLIKKNEYKFKIREITDPEKNAIESLLVIEVCYDDENGSPKAMQGTGFQLNNVGIVTCAHVVSEDKVIFKDIKAFKHTDFKTVYNLKVERICYDRDIAICSIPNDLNDLCSLEKAETSLKQQDIVKLLGFPNYMYSSSHNIVEAKISRTYVQSSINKFEIDKQIRKGNSGGPVLNANSQVVGIALEGVTDGIGNNGCLYITEIEHIIKSNEYIVQSISADV